MTNEATSKPKALYYEIVYVGSAGHLRRFKVTEEDGTFVPGGLFKTEREAIAFIDARIAECIEPAS